ncbi:hypothetical protein [Actinosynnema pretiosum]|uniref:Uncharacterized protein n=1 Tax=Actinosynnema pretiosum TaxID=42197 RepID=A0A290YZA1_9PSEU|nr:hypothetical protein [Actinosynnema pretiosum]ATE52096.1 hypothetical protein CNX65_01330 [Actinosynnema pretiosum]
MATELGVELRGAPEQFDAERVVTSLRGLLDLLLQVEKGQAARSGGPPPRKTSWAFKELRLGSLATRIAPTPDSDQKNRQHWTVGLVAEGLEFAEQNQAIPPHWDLDAASAARKFLDRVGDSEDSNMVVLIYRDDEPAQRIEITRRAADNLRAATAAKFTSLGSLIGRLDSINTHSGYEAGLWPDISNHRVTVKFTEDQLEVIRSAIKKRVEVRGELHRNYRGDPISIKMTGLEILETKPGSRLTDLAGLFAGGDA